MALINNLGKIVLNNNQPTIIFQNEESFIKWENSLENYSEDINKFNIVKKYTTIPKFKIVSCLINGESFGVVKPLQPLTLVSDTQMKITPKWTNGGTMKYSIDSGESWHEILSGSPTIYSKKASFKGNMATNSLYSESSLANAWRIEDGTNVRASGDITAVLKSEGGVEVLNDFAFDHMFYNCTSLIVPPELPSLILGESCYNAIFSGCFFLISPPESLPAMVLGKNCYRRMFTGCYAMETAPELPATILTDLCYCEMFSDCRSLIKAPELPSTLLATDCYKLMFAQCPSLVKAPELPAVDLKDNCYAAMFYGCISLPKAPRLPSTILSNYCYQEMFNKCTSLINPPELPATILTLSCYHGMFKECTSLTSAPKLLATIFAENSYTEMFANTSSTLFSTTSSEIYNNEVKNGGTFYYNNFSYNQNLIPAEKLYSKTTPPDYFTLTSDTNMTVAPK